MSARSKSAFVGHTTNAAIEEINLQADRVRKILDEAILKLKILSCMPRLLENDGEMLYKYLDSQEADFVIVICTECEGIKHLLYDRPEMVRITNIIDRINMYEKKSSVAFKQRRSFVGNKSSEAHVSFMIDIICKCKPLVDYLLSLEPNSDALVVNFIDSMTQLSQIADKKLRVSANEELKRENDLKTAYRYSQMLCGNIEELEEQIEKQREELGNEYDRKQLMLEHLNQKLEEIKEKSKQDINNIVYESETNMMKAYNKSVPILEGLKVDADESVEVYDKLLQDHLAEEKGLRAKRFKVEAQLASWVAKYDTDMGEKLAEFEELENTYNAEQEEYDKLQDKFFEQEEEYLVLMKEKEEEERRINEEKAWIFLQNRAARKIQRCWRAYKARKLARKRRAKKKKKKMGKKSPRKPKSTKSTPRSSKSKTPKKPKKAKKKGKTDKKEDKLTLKGGPDPNAIIEGKFNSELLSDIKTIEAFDKKDIKNIVEEGDELAKEVAQKKKHLEEITTKIFNLQLKAGQDIQHIVYNSEMTYQKTQTESLKQQEEIAAEARRTTWHYHNLLDCHLNEEKNLRQNRLQVEQQLANLIAKYDLNIGKKLVEYEKLEEVHREEIVKYQILQARFDEQTKEYVILMKEKEDEERRIAEEKARRFLLNFAATRIQRYWKAYRERKFAKKKGRKSKKAKKEVKKEDE